MTLRLLTWMTIFSTLMGGVLWVALWQMDRNALGFLPQAEQLMFFGVGVVVPLALRLTAQPNRHGQLSAVYSLAVRIHPIVIIVVGASLLLTPGLPAGILASVWFIQTLLIAIYGLKRLLPRPTIAIE